jgi:hypothetical protein
MSPKSRKLILVITIAFLATSKLLPSLATVVTNSSSRGPNGTVDFLCRGWQPAIMHRVGCDLPFPMIGWLFIIFAGVLLGFYFNREYYLEALLVICLVFLLSSALHYHLLGDDYCPCSFYYSHWSWRVDSFWFLVLISPILFLASIVKVIRYFAIKRMVK